ncbi:MAG: hypothetical protein IJW33_07325 [Lentisphaeria bacterium]|nr:hypothetical protein [Lentisphaeria bacterium]MBQ9787961.1 hypothetical protein [Lentisphaeria bacterium]
MNKVFIFSFFLAAAVVIVRAVADVIRCYGRTMALHGYWRALDDMRRRDLAQSCDEIVKRVIAHKNGEVEK